MKVTSWLCAVFAALLLVARPSRAQITPPTPAASTEAPTSPMLRIETGAHAATITRIGVDRAGRFLVTGSFDKTVRVWSLADGRLLRILRPPIGDGLEGRIDAVAISPDGGTIACGGWTGWDWDGTASIYMFDTETGTLTRRISQLPNIVLDLSFSPDGRFLAAGLGRNYGVRVFAAADGGQVMTDNDYGDDCYGTDWDPTGRLVTSSIDGFIRLYGAAPELALTSKIKAPGGSRPVSVRFSPDGSRIAVGFDDAAAVTVLSGSSLDTLYSADVTGVAVTDTVSKVCWSSDGTTLYAAGTARDSNNHFYIRAWSGGGRGAYRDSAVAENRIMDLRSLASGRAAAAGALVYGSSEPAWGVLRADGQKRIEFDQTASTADYRNIGDGFRLAKDGSSVSFGFRPFGEQPAELAIPDRTLSIGGQTGQAAAAPTLTPPLTQADGINVADWQFTNHPTLNGQALPLAQGELSRSLAIAPDQQSFLLGTSFRLHCFGRDGTEKWNLPVPDEPWAVNVTPSGRVVVAAFGDGTIRWYRMQDGKELLDFFPHADKKRWVLWTPAGYYDCSPGGEDLIGWHINRGKDQTADFFPASRFRDIYYRPDVIQLVLTTLDDDEALRLANLAVGHKTTDPTANVETRLPPVVAIVSPSDLSSASEGKVTVRFTVRTPDDAPVTAVRALVDGRPLDTVRGLDLSAVGAGPDTSGVREIVVPVPARDCEVSIIAENKNSTSVPATLRLKVAAEFIAKPKLYVLAIGVGTYTDTKDIPQLHFPAKDARDFANVLKAQAGGLYRDVEVKILTDASATRDDVEDGLDWIQKQTTSHDVAIIFLSGHGDNDSSGEYSFLPRNFDPEKWKRTAVPYTDIQSTLRNIAGKALFFVDTCHSGNVDGSGALRKGTEPDINRVVNELSSAENGVIVFTASTGKQYALEDTAWGNGAFTKAVVEGLSGKADYQHTGRITVNMLDLYVSERVKELTGGRQTPTTAKPATVPDFPVAAVH